MRNCDIFNYASRTWDIAKRNLLWHVGAKIESENLGGSNIFENDERKNNFEVENFGRKSFVIWNHKDSDLIHVCLIHANSNQLIPDNLTKMRSINDSDHISAIEKIFTSLVQLVHTPSPVSSP